MRAALGLLAALALSACGTVTPEDMATGCEKARTAAAWASTALTLVCVRQSAACEAAGAALASANATVRAMCVATGAPTRLSP